MGHTNAVAVPQGRAAYFGPHPALAKGTLKRSPVATRPGIDHNGTEAEAETMLFDAAEAGNWLEEYAYDGQRKINPIQLEMLCDAIRKGKLAISTIRLVHFGKHAFVTDGRHRLQAVFQTGIETPFVVLHIYARSMEEVEQDYARNSGNKPRTTQEILSSLHLNIKTGMNAWQLKFIDAGVRIIMTGFRPNDGLTDAVAQLRVRSIENRAEVIEEWQAEARAYYNCITGTAKTYHRLLTRKYVVAIALTTLRYQREKAEEFWATTAQDEGLVKGNPQKTLLRYLLANDASAWYTKRQHVGVANCWNAYFGNRSYNEVRNTNVFEINGTPVTHRAAPAMPLGKVK